jgi:hypothetical protein
MYRIPKDLELSKIVGQFTTQIHVGQFNIQFTFGDVSFAVQSPIKLIRSGEVVGSWHEGVWPSPQFFEIMNIEVAEYRSPDDRTIIICLNNGLEVHLSDNSDQFECMQISFAGEDAWVI